MKPELINCLKGYKKNYIVSDILSGLLVAIIALPLSIALGISSVPEESAAMGIQMGIITAIVAGFLISALGGSRFQIGGPTAAFAAILVGYIATAGIGFLGLKIATICAGILLIILGFLKCGKVIKYIPFSIVIGFTAGIGITLLFGQLQSLFGLTIPKEAVGTSFITKLISYGKFIGTFNIYTFLLGVLGLLIIYLMQAINRKIPGAIIAIIVCTLLNLLFNAIGANTGIATIGSAYGEISASFNFISFAEIEQVSFVKLIKPTLVIAFLCAIESLLSATVADGMAKTKHDSNQELVGQGVANIGSALLGGLPATGAIARTAANINGGAKTALSGVFHAIFVLIMYFALMSVVQYVPLTVFASILISVAIKMSNFPLVVKLIKFGIRDGIILIVTCLLTVFFDLTYGVLGGLALTLLINIQNIIHPLKIEKIEVDNKLTYKLTGSLYFISVNKLIASLTEEYKEKQEIFIDMTALKRVDCTSIERVTKLNKVIKSQGKSMELIGYNEKICERLDKYFKVL